MQDQDLQGEEDLLGAYVNLYNGHRWPKEAHRLSCISMFRIFLDHMGVGAAVRSFYHTGRLPDIEGRYSMWKQCLSLKKLSVSEQQEKLDAIHKAIEDDRRNPLKNHNHPFVLRSQPPANLVDPEAKITTNWNIRERVLGVNWDQDPYFDEFAEAEKIVTQRKLRSEGPHDEDSYCSFISNNGGNDKFIKETIHEMNKKSSASK